MKDFLRIADLDAGGLRHLLRLTATVKPHPRRWRHVLADQLVVLAFSEPSTRTRLSFEAAVQHLGGAAAFVGPHELQLDRGETIEDTARVASGFAKALVIRTRDHADVDRWAAAATVPVVNALTDRHHPCQALADLFTLHEHFGRLAGLRVAYLGDGNSVANSLVEACALAGVDIVVATPPGYEPDERSVEFAEGVATRQGSLVLTTHDPLIAAAGAHAIYTDVWLSRADPIDEVSARVAALSPYRVDAGVVAEADPDAVFLHRLPAHRGQEVTADIIDGPRSLVWAQAENRMHTAQAVLLSLVPGGQRFEQTRCTSVPAATR
jgi:ornithine carbamoyltransferase